MAAFPYVFRCYVENKSFSWYIIYNSLLGKHLRFCGCIRKPASCWWRVLLYVYIGGLCQAICPEIVRPNIGYLEVPCVIALHLLYCFLSLPRYTEWLLSDLHQWFLLGAVDRWLDMPKSMIHFNRVPETLVSDLGLVIWLTVGLIAIETPFWRVARLQTPHGEPLLQTRDLEPLSSFLTKIWPVQLPLVRYQVQRSALTVQPGIWPSPVACVLLSWFCLVLIKTGFILNCSQCLDWTVFLGTFFFGGRSSENFVVCPRLFQRSKYFFTAETCRKNAQRATQARCDVCRCNESWNSSTWGWAKFSPSHGFVLNPL